MSDLVKSLDERIYNLLVSSQKSYGDIGKEVGCSAAQVSKRANAIVKDLNLNPSLLRSSKKIKYHARYCGRIECHALFYVTPAEIRSKKPLYCSRFCAGKIKIPSGHQIRSAYQTGSFKDVANKFNLSYNLLAKLFEEHNIKPKEFPEVVLVTLAGDAQKQSHRIKPRRTSFASVRSGFREHLGFTVRSSWENNFCLYLQHQGIDFEYEPEMFTFPERTGASAYVPDFKLKDKNKEIWVEVKGRLMSSDLTKMRRLKKHYPHIFKKMTYIVDKPNSKADKAYKKLGLKPYMYYNELKSDFENILKNWES